MEKITLLITARAKTNYVFSLDQKKAPFYYLFTREGNIEYTVQNKTA
jgi:hypothetical protein